MAPLRIANVSCIVVKKKHTPKFDSVMLRDPPHVHVLPTVLGPETLLPTSTYVVRDNEELSGKVWHRPHQHRPDKVLSEEHLQQKEEEEGEEDVKYV